MKKLLKHLGPGLLFASMAIGTSHLVLSTKAGAQYGWLMVIPILLALVLKYPFFEFGVRYTHIFKKSLLEGYVSLGKKYLWAYTFITFISSFTILAALYIVTAGLLKQLMPWFNISDSNMALVLFIVISALLIIGKYKFLELSIKFILGILTLALIVSTTVVLYKGPIDIKPTFTPLPFFDKAGLLFLIGLIGWMPTAVEASSWVSMWRLEKNKTQINNQTLKDCLREFNLGYIITALLAICFLIIGWFTLYGSGVPMSSNATLFAAQLIQMFTTHMGPWAYYFIAMAAFVTMFSTCLTAHDALARVCVESFQLLKKKKTSSKNWYFNLLVVLLAFINFNVISWAGGNMGNLVGIATFVSFVFAPAVGLLNHRMVTQKKMPPEATPPRGLIVLSYLGMIFLSLFAIYYCYIILR
ncbi:MAG: Mn2+/Fe2+ NRAMP family transporter [Flavobacteriaceae bacterium]|jgi:Mn2+/Fe2+ NRAMP family transporter